MANGQPVTSARMWMEKRRPELLKLFETYEYGRSPGRPVITTIGFHLRCGPHNVTAYDWDQFLDFADKHMKAH